MTSYRSIILHAVLGAGALNSRLQTRPKLHLHISSMTSRSLRSSSMSARRIGRSAERSKDLVRALLPFRPAGLAACRSCTYHDDEDSQQLPQLAFERFVGVGCDKMTKTAADRWRDHTKNKLLANFAL